MTKSKTIAKTDVLIVGAGPTGLLLANLLGSMGVETVVIERNDGTVQEPRAVSIDDESMRALQAAGLSSKVEKIVTRGYGSIYKGPSGQVFSEVKPSSKEFGFDKRNAFQQPRLESLLLNGLKRFESVKFFFKTTMVSFKDNSETVIASVKPHEGNEYEIVSRYMIACDGGQSATRKALGIKMLGTTFEEPWLIVDLKTTKNSCFHTEVLCDPSRSCITLPGPYGIRRYEFKLRKGEDPERIVEESNVRKLLRLVGDDENEEIQRVRVYTFHARLAEFWRKKRIFLAGDAAHLTPPFAGQGMNSGLRDAHNLAWKLSEALQSSDVSDRFLDSYETERKPHAAAMINLALRMGQIMMPSSRVQGALIRGGFRVLGLYPPAKDYFSQMRYKPKPRFKDGLVWQSMDTENIVGQMFPQPVVEGVDRERILLDKILKDKLTVIVFSESPEKNITAKMVEKILQENVKVIGLTPEWMNPKSTYFPIFRDCERVFSKKPFKKLMNRTFLLRRDRYVAASKTFEKTDDLIPIMQALMAKA
ncbi:MAG: bifunctional 3-(3-hydroxy-phenyl)propionate/3-hydroxycinnamic acid hydroxylase [Rhodobacterales bacterium]